MNGRYINVSLQGGHGALICFRMYGGLRIYWYPVGFVYRGQRQMLMIQNAIFPMSIPTKRVLEVFIHRD